MAVSAEGQIPFVVNGIEQFDVLLALASSSSSLDIQNRSHVLLYDNTISWRTLPS